MKLHIIASTSRPLQNLSDVELKRMLTKNLQNNRAHDATPSERAEASKMIRRCQKELELRESKKFEGAVWRYTLDIEKSWEYLSAAADDEVDATEEGVESAINGIIKALKDLPLQGGKSGIIDLFEEALSASKSDFPEEELNYAYSELCDWADNLRVWVKTF